MPACACWPSEPRPIGQWFPVKVHHAAAEVPGRIVVLRDQAISAGETDYVQLVLERPIAAAAGDRFVVRDTSSSRTVGGGVLIDVRAPERRRRTPERRAEIAAMAEREPARAVARAAGGSGRLDRHRRLRARPGAAARKPSIGLFPSLSLVTFPLGTAAPRCCRPTGSACAARSAGRSMPSMRSGPTCPASASSNCARARSRRCPRRFSWRRCASSPRPARWRSTAPGCGGRSHEVRFSAEEERIWALVLPRLAGEPYRPPRVRDIAKAMGIDEGFVRRLMRMAARRGDVEEIAHDHFFARPVVEDMARIAIDVAAASPTGKFTAADFRDRLDNGRKVAIQILEFFDRHGFTIRRQDLRRINPARVEFFAPEAAQAANGGVPLPVGRPDFKSGWGRQTVSGGFDSHPPPPPPHEVSR